MKEEKLNTDLSVEKLDLSEMEELEGGVRHNGCIVSNGKCNGEGTGCGVCNGKCNLKENTGTSGELVEQP